MANIERLEHLIAVLERPEVQGHFDMHEFCGTCMCIGGHAASDKHFQDQGLHFADWNVPVTSDFPDQPFEALQEFFDLSEKATWCVFYLRTSNGLEELPSYTADRHSIPAAIQRIRDVIAEVRAGDRTP